MFNATSDAAGGAGGAGGACLSDGKIIVLVFVLVVFLCGLAHMSGRLLDAAAADHAHPQLQKEQSGKVGCGIPVAVPIPRTQV